MTTPKTSKTPTKTTKTVVKDPMHRRKCEYCMVPFTPRRMQDKDASFCTERCRKAFWTAGGLPLRILMRPLEAQMRRHAESLGAVNLADAATELLAKELNQRLKEFSREFMSDVKHVITNMMETRLEKFRRTWDIGPAETVEPETKTEGTP